MLPPHIIEELRKREKYRQDQDGKQPHIELPLPAHRPAKQPDERRGVVIIELF
jgi:hypothetical protein